MEMMMSLNDLVKRAARSSFVFEAIKDATGVRGISLSFIGDEGLEHFYVLNDDGAEFASFIDDVFSAWKGKVCFDMRDLERLGVKRKEHCDVVAVSPICGEASLMKAVNANIKESDVVEFELHKKRMGSHVRACRTARIDLERHSLVDVVPSKLMVGFHRLKNEMVWELYNRLDEWELDRYREVIYDRVQVLNEIEKSRVMVSPVDYEEGSVGDGRFVEDLRRRMDGDGYVDVRYGHVFKKTGRVHPERGSWNCMNIPSTHVRRSIVSRWDGGRILRMDLNAADYRCIVASANDDELNALYSEGMDFHDRTVELVFGPGRATATRRRVIKDITYIMLYGGSRETLMERTGLTDEMLDETMRRLEGYVAPLVEFKERLFERSMASGYVENPYGLRMKLQGDEHAGKVLAWYAQSCANDVFWDGVAGVLKVMDKSKPLFTVHDELVIDLHPDEICNVKELRDAMELSSAAMFEVGMRVCAEIGPNYWELEEWN